MTDRAIGKLDSTRKLLLSLAGWLTVAAVVLFGLVDAAKSRAQTPTDTKTQSIADTWQGTLHTGRDLRTVVKISKADDGGYKAVLYNIDQSGDGITASKITLDGTTVKITLAFGSYEGTLDAGPNPLPLILTRATPDTAWTIPPPEVKMDPNAKPGFEVATIKPSPPDRPGKNFGFRGGHFLSRNTNLNDLIAFAYGLHAKQIVDAPAWFGTDLYDIEGKPDVEGRPSPKQMQTMVQGLLTDRFQLKFHHDKRELSVYVISVANGGPKMTKSTAGPDDPIGFGLRGLGDLVVRNLTMTGFATWMQSGVMDKPVVDQTELSDRYDFTLKWTPDESQFAQFRGTGTVVPTPTDDPKAPPSLYTAMQEQLGLKMGPAKFPDDVIVIDHAEKPSEN
jgi:uncharacterized protein (TIGR03435 family)